MRETNFYWVKIDGQWEPASWHSEYEFWIVMGMFVQVYDCDIEEIGPVCTPNYLPTVEEYHEIES